MSSAPPTHRPRREHSRLRLNLPARLVTTEGEKLISLLNLSQGGARVRLPADKQISGGVLKWMDNEVYGVKVWQAGPEVGLKFDHPIDWNWVVATRHWQPPRRTKRDDSLSYARDWAKGVNQEKFEANAQLDAQVRRNIAALDIHKLRRSGNRLRWARRWLAILLLSVAVGLGVGLWGKPI